MFNWSAAWVTLAEPACARKSGNYYPPNRSSSALLLGLAANSTKLRTTAVMWRRNVTASFASSSVVSAAISSESWHFRQCPVHLRRPGLAFSALALKIPSRGSRSPAARSFIRNYLELISAYNPDRRRKREGDEDLRQVGNEKVG